MSLTGIPFSHLLLLWLLFRWCCCSLWPLYLISNVRAINRRKRVKMVEYSAGWGNKEADSGCWQISPTLPSQGCSCSRGPWRRQPKREMGNLKDFVQIFHWYKLTLICPKDFSKSGKMEADEPFDHKRVPMIRNSSLQGRPWKQYTSVPQQTKLSSLLPS